MPSSAPTTELSLADQTRRAFAAAFGVAPKWLVRAPGRVNLIGEHVDYNDGPVLPFAIGPQVMLAAAPNGGTTVRVRSEACEGVAEIPLGGAMEKGEPRGTNYLRGVIAGFQRRGVSIPGFDLLITADLPQGCGLSSSAALEVGMATMIEAVTGAVLPLREKGLLCQKAEHEFAGVPCGIMDQFASVFGREGHLILLDCRSQEVSHIPMPQEDVAFLIVDTRVKHSLADSAYAKRRATCEGAARTLGVASLRDWPVERLAEAEAKLDAEAYRRTRHVVTEIARTFDAVEKIKAGQWSELGRLMYQSHASLRDDYEVSCPELDEIVRLAGELGEAGGIYGCRMTGGGFGGSTIALVKASALESVQEQLQRAYTFPKGLGFIATTPAEGASVLAPTDS